ncbi:MAG: FeoA family protein [Desulfotomaculales bacterium]
MRRSLPAGGTARLGELPPGARAVVRSVAAEKNVRQRLFDLGFVPGAEVEAIRTGPLGDPGAYGIQGAVFALRKEDARKILVEVQGCSP